MIRPDTFISELSGHGFRLFTGVPCSFLKPLINYVLSAEGLRYIPAVNEGDGVAIAAGSEIAGQPAVVMMQNSGLGNCVNPLSSLTAIFKIPVLLLVSLRGEPGAKEDEPQHALMGHITTELLELLEIPWANLTVDEEKIHGQLHRAVQSMLENRKPYALVVKKGSFAGWPAPDRTVPVPELERRCGEAETGAAVASRTEILKLILNHATPDDVLLATTGFTGRELYSLRDAPNHLYMVGSMGCIGSFSLGVALAAPRKRIIAIDGDGALLMRLGSLAVIGRQRPANLVHILLDNGMYESTGGQPSVSGNVDFPAVARACGYPAAIHVKSLDELTGHLHGDGARPLFLHIKTAPGVIDPLPRPAITPEAVAVRLRNFLRETK